MVGNKVVPHVLFILVNTGVCCYCPRNMFTELSQGCWSSRYKNLFTYEVSSSTVVFFVSYMHVHAPYVLFVVFIVYISYMTMFAGTQSFISLRSFMVVSAVVSELCESNQNKKEEDSKIGYFQFNTFPGYHFLIRGTF